MSNFKKKESISLQFDFFKVNFSGHRGYKGKEIENTRAGFLRAIEEKLDYVEFDVRKTKDGAPIVFHDRRIDRLLNGRGKVRNYTLRELQEFRYKNGESILTLEEFFILTSEKIKEILHLKSKGIADVVIQLVKRFNHESDVIVQSASRRILSEAYAIAPEIEYAIYRSFIGSLGRVGKLTRLNKLTAPIFYRMLVRPKFVKYVSLDGPFMYDEFIAMAIKRGLKIILGAMWPERYLKNIEKWNIWLINSNDPAKIKDLYKKYYEKKENP